MEHYFEHFQARVKEKFHTRHPVTPWAEAPHYMSARKNALHAGGPKHRLGKVHPEKTCRVSRESSQQGRRNALVQRSHAFFLQQSSDGHAKFLHMARVPNIKSRAGQTRTGQTGVKTRQCSFRKCSLAFRTQRIRQTD